MSRLTSTPSAGSSGTVTSVDVAAPAPLASSGGPVTASGTVTLAWAAGQTANRVLASPDASSGAVALRALVAADVPALDAAKVTSGAFAAARIGSVNPSTLTGTGTVPLAALSGLTTSQLDAAAAITSAQIAALATSKLTGTVSASQLAVSAPTSGQVGGLTTSNLSATAGILGSQLDSAAAIVSGQITSLAASKLTGTNTLPDGVLSTNVPLLASANTFTAAQTISATVAGVLAQVNNASTTGAGLVIGSTTVASAGAGLIAPALALTQAPPATTRYGLLSAGGGFWDGSTTGKFVGSASGTLYAGNAASGFGGNLADLQVAGSSKFKVDASGNVTLTSVSAATSVGCTSLSAPNDSTGSTIALSTTVPVTIKSITAAVAPLIAKGVASQTADLQQWQDSAAAVQFGITNRGSGGSPIWALKVRATANAESAAQAHVIGAATGKAIEVMDDAGASLGFIPIYA